MSYTSLQAITNYLYTSLHADYPSLAIAFDNVSFNPDNVDEFVRITVMPATSNQLESGATSAFRFTGTVIISVFVKENIGTNRMYQIVESITGYCRMKTLDKIAFRGESVTNPDNIESGWFQRNINVPFRYEEIYNRQED